jgi:hypothetical protein
MRVGVGCALLLFLLAACALDWTVIPNEGGSGAPCTIASPCRIAEYCDFPDNRCGQGGEGRCRAVPPVTTCASETVVELVCTCSGLVAKSRCQANADGLDFNVAGGCKPVADTADCGFLQCNFKTAFCLERTDSTGVDYACVAWKCPQFDCTCPELVGLCATPRCERRPDGTSIVRCAR